MRLIRTIGILIFVACIAWFAAGLVYAFGFLLAAGYSPNDWHPWGELLLLGTVLGFFGAIGGAVLFGVAEHTLDERRWRRDLRRGTATIHDPRPGELASNFPTQELICQLEIRAHGMAAFRGTYRASVGPLDATRLLEGATLACQVSTALPERVRLWLVAPPGAAELTGRHLDFQPVAPARGAEGHA
jgi:hypothetical protein